MFYPLLCHHSLVLQILSKMEAFCALLFSEGVVQLLPPDRP